MGQLVHTLPEGEPVCGVTSLADEIYLLRDKECDNIEVYDVITNRLQRCLTVPNARGVSDMTSCEHYRCVYIGMIISLYVYCVHRLDVKGAATRWAVNDEPFGISVNAVHNVLVTCRDVRKIKEFSSHGDLVRELTLPDDVISPWHAIQTHNGEFIVCHGDFDDAVHRVCKVSVSGHDIVQSHDGQRGSATGLYDVPLHLAVDNNEFVFVIDINNRRVTLLSPTLGYIRQVVSRDQLDGLPDSLYLDTQRRRLYVVDCEWNDEEKRYTAGRVVVLIV